jgi:ATP-dependent Clp protease protease subunit
MGAVLLAAGKKGKRYCLPHARVMIHQPMGGASGQASDIEIQTKEILRLKEKLNKIIADHTGQDLKVINRDTDRDFFMGAKAGIEYGLIDEILIRRPKAD